jgi:hypothetical protein
MYFYTIKVVNRLKRIHKQLCKNIEKIDFLDRIMGNFGSKEDILVEIAVLYKQMDNGRLTIDELEELVKLTSKLHERALILRYKAFEEKVFGVIPAAVVEEIPEIEEEIQEEINDDVIINRTPIIEVAEVEEEIIAQNNAELEDDSTEIDEPIFKVEVKQEAAFGFSLFGDDLEIEEEKVVENEIVEHPVNLDDEIGIEKEEVIVPEEINHFSAPLVDEIPEVDFVQKEIVEETPEVKPMSDIERAHAENLARFFNKSQENQVTPPQIEPKVFTSDFTHEEEIMEYTPDSVQANVEEVTFQNDENITFESEESIDEPTLEIDEEEEDKVEYRNDFEEKEISYSTPPNTESPFEIKNEDVIEEPAFESSMQSSTFETAPDNSFDQAVISAFIHKYNQVGSNLASQFGVSKLDSLIGSFGLNERLQFINELFDGSSESFANAIKGLDQQANSESARSKVAEFAIENNWDVDSETVEEFMQKVVRRYA